MTRFNTILVTGAAGRLGTELRRGLAPLARRLRLADVVPARNLAANEEAMTFDLADEAAVHAACQGVDAVVHSGGVPLERPWAQILDANIRGSYHISEGRAKPGSSGSSMPPPSMPSAITGLRIRSTPTPPTVPTGFTGCRNASSKILGGSTGTSSESKRRRCASFRRSPNRRTGGCCGRGCPSTIAFGLWWRP